MAYGNATLKMIVFTDFHNLKSDCIVAVRQILPLKLIIKAFIYYICINFLKIVVSIPLHSKSKISYRFQQYQILF
jgi:hypothetical protein